METIYLSKVTDGERNLSRIVGFLSALPKEKAFEVIVTERRNTRSVQQCRYLNGVAYRILSEATGYERDDISEFMCGQYWGWKDKKVPGKKIVQVPLRTTTTNESGKRSVLSKTDFCDFVAFVQRFGAQHNVFIPDPE